MSQMGGGLRWHGVSKTGSTATSRIMNAAKAEREKANRSAPKVGSASVTDGDDWLAVAAAERAARERTGATGNAFADGASLVREAKRQATADDDEFAIPPSEKRARVDDELGTGAAAGTRVGSVVGAAMYLTYNYRKSRIEAVHRVQASTPPSRAQRRAGWAVRDAAPGSTPSALP